MKNDFKGNKSSLPSKPCAVCQRPMTWRKAWAKNWESVRYCSDACRAKKGTVPSAGSAAGDTDGTLSRQARHQRNCRMSAKKAADANTAKQPVRNLVIVLGDQLDHQSTALEGFDPAVDVVWMAEVAEESEHVWSSKQRTTVFLSAMRHFAAELRGKGWAVDYTTLDAPGNTGTLAGELARAVPTHQPKGLVLTAPGDWRVLQSLRAAAQDAKLPMDLRDDPALFQHGARLCCARQRPQAVAFGVLVPGVASEDTHPDGWQRAGGWSVEL